MDDRYMREACLRLALKGETVHDVVAAARAYFNFLQAGGSLSAIECALQTGVVSLHYQDALKTARDFEAFMSAAAPEDHSKAA